VREGGGGGRVSGTGCRKERKKENPHNVIDIGTPPGGVRGGIHKTVLRDGVKRVVRGNSRAISRVSRAEEREEIP